MLPSGRSRPAEQPHAECFRVVDGIIAIVEVQGGEIVEVQSPPVALKRDFAVEGHL
jgi:hypothetical protein